MPSKEDFCVQDSIPDKFLPSSEMEELVAAIKHNLHLKSKPSHSVFTKRRRMSPYAAPVRSVCRNNLNNSDSSTEHSTPNCRYCIIKSKSAKCSSDDPFEILNFLKKGILISEAVKRIQLDTENRRPKKTNFYEVDDLEVESV